MDDRRDDMDVKLRVGETVEVSPFRCRLWGEHDRLEEFVTTETCRAEIQSFLVYGQRVAVLGRYVVNEDGCDVEIICGARRLFVARHLNVPLLVEIREMSDREAIIAMDIENRQRADVSAYERGMSFSRWLASGHFGSQEDIVKTLHISRAQVSRLLKLAKLPAVVVGAFVNPDDLREEWGVVLSDVLQDEKSRVAVIGRARSFARTRAQMSAKEIFQELMGAAVSVRVRKRHIVRDEIIRDKNGRALFSIREQSMAIALVLPKRRVSLESLVEIQREVARILNSDDEQRGRNTVDVRSSVASTRASAQDAGLASEMGSIEGAEA